MALSAIVPLFRDRSDVVEVYEAYKAALESLGRRYELIYVLSWQSERALADLKAARSRGEDALVLVLGQQVDEAEALLNGFERARGEVVLTLPADLPGRAGRHSEGSSWARALRGRGRPAAAGQLDAAADPGQGVPLAAQAAVRAHADLVCRVRAWRRPVTEEIRLHGVQPHFLPLLAGERGFRIREVDVRPGTSGRAGVKLTLLDRISVALDILALYLVLKFTKKPLRFGMIRLPILLAGVVFCAVLAFARLVYDVQLADRPALVLAVLLVVLGIQIIGARPDRRARDLRLRPAHQGALDRAHPLRVQLAPARRGHIESRRTCDRTRGMP